MTLPHAHYVPAPQRLADVTNLRLGARLCGELATKIECAYDEAPEAARIPLEAALEVARKCATECAHNATELERADAYEQACKKEQAGAAAALERARMAERSLVTDVREPTAEDVLTRRDEVAIATIAAERASHRYQAARLASAAIPDPWPALRRLVDEAKSGTERLANAAYRFGHNEAKTAAEGIRGDLVRLGASIVFEGEIVAEFKKDATARKKAGEESALERLDDVRHVFAQRLAHVLGGIAAKKSDAERRDIIDRIERAVVAQA